MCRIALATVNARSSMRAALRAISYGHPQVYRRKLCTAMATKAIQVAEFGGPEVVKYVDLPRPQATDGHVLVKNEYAGVNFIDTYHRSGVYHVQLPYVLGVEGSGIVLEANNTSKVAPGDKVAYVAPHSYAQHTVVPAGRLVRLPDSLSVEEGAASMIQGMTAWCLTNKAYEVMQPGEYVLVHAAAGGTGQMLVQLAALKGAHVIGTTSTEEKAKIAHDLGAEHVILYKTVDVVTEVQRITGGKGVAVVYDGVGKSTFDTSLACLATLGTLISFGNASGKVDPVDILKLAPRNVKLMRPSLFSFITSDEVFDAIATEVLFLVMSKKLRIQISNVYPLHEAEQAHKDLQSGLTTGKLLLKC